MEARRRAALALASFCAFLEHPLRVPGAATSPESLWRRGIAGLSAALRLSEKDSERLAEFRKSWSYDKAIERLSRLNLSMVAIGEPGYPARLARIPDPPIALFIAGERARLEEFMNGPRIAIVGSRDATAYGCDATRHLASGLSRQGVCVVSGMAFGIDTVAHEAALAAGGDSIAVLGCGPESPYPRRNRGLYGELLKRGLVLSEYPPGTEPRPWRFPARNRIISGLANGVIVVEAAEKSGALITADFCLEQGGEVFAVPGSIFSRQSSGVNQLIRSGAAAVTTAAEVMEALGFRAAAGAIELSRGAEAPPAGVERQVWRALGDQPKPAEAIAASTGIGLAETLAALTLLELGGHARFEAGRGYCL